MQSKMVLVDLALISSGVVFWMAKGSSIMSQEMSFALAIRVSSKKAIKASQVGTLHGPLLDLVSSHGTCQGKSGLLTEEAMLQSFALFLHRYCWLPWSLFPMLITTGIIGRMVLLEVL
uniref:Uncharacterized protein n=1 Tax=Opuntia streptacantha TaxID=393608 RepID=A0A7C9EE95_OPUST